LIGVLKGTECMYDFSSSTKLYSFFLFSPKPFEVYKNADFCLYSRVLGIFFFSVWISIFDFSALVER